MKKLLMLFLLFPVNSGAEDFTPTPMTLSVQPQIEYNFDGSLEIPFTLTGQSGAFWLVINTHGQADNIIGVKNGYLGWHYVNKIDTTIYISDRFERTPGENTIVWDGRDENGNKAEPGTYDYYLWGYDDKSNRQKVCDYIPIGFIQGNQFNQIYENGEDGMSLPRPLIMGANWVLWSNESLPYKKHGVHYKWEIGGDPFDTSLIQTTMCGIYEPPYLYIQNEVKTLLVDYSYGNPVFDPKNHNIFYHCCFNVPNLVSTMLKWEFVPGGEAIKDENWLGWENLSMIEPSSNNGVNAEMPGCYTDGDYIYPISSRPMGRDQWNKLRCISFDGELIFDKEMQSWFLEDDTTPGALVNGAFNKAYSRNNNNVLMSGRYCCILQMINTSRLIEDPDDETDMVVYENRNGDYFLDTNYASDSDPAWSCFRNKTSFDGKWNTVGYWRDSVSIDSNGFGLIFLSLGGLVSFGVVTQDGTGIEELAFGDEYGSDKWSKGGGLLCDSGSAYDGLYMNGAWKAETTSFHDIAQTYYIAFDSAKGMITNNPAVESQNPLQFKVNQNIPNPFNPSTTISFSIPEKSNVSIDIYNIAGQKIKTLINSTMSAGEHSIKWDAGGCSAGVYFYKIKAGKYEKTMRMTLVK